jgi:hypothetical protein
MADHVYNTNGILPKASIDRKAVEAQIETLIAMLDEMDGDPDIEENGDEFDTGMPEGWRGTSIYYAAETGYAGPILEDDEDGNNAEEDPADSEPALGWTNHMDQTVAAMVHNVPPTGEDEPSLGWCGHGRGFVVGADSAEDTEANGDELDLNGDEKDWSGYPGEFDLCGWRSFDGSGDLIAKQMLASIRRAAQ